MLELLSLSTIGSFIGGLGLFLLAVNMITDGLRLVAGDALREMLGRWTRTPLHGIGFGAVLTAVVQSSSAVTVATIGFVNASVLSMENALGVVFGANIGTTMTGWLVAAVGFKLKVEAFALPMIGVGMAMRLTGAQSRRAAIGEALAGFGLFFIGIDVLREGFEGLEQGIDLTAVGTGSFLSSVWLVVAGFLMTLVTQSSSAAIAITLTAASGGLLTLNAAAAMVIGANVGTTSTAAFAAIGATPNAKRVAMAHVIFNCVTGVVALMILPLMLWMVRVTGQLLDLDLAPAVALALFHTLFNVLGVLLMYPFTSRLAVYLRQRFTSLAETMERPRFIDSTITRAPVLALDAIQLELRHILELVRQMAVTALQVPVNRPRLEALHKAVSSLDARVDACVLNIGKQRLSDDSAEALPRVMHITHQIEEAARAAESVGQESPESEYAQQFLASALDALRAWRPEEPERTLQLVERRKPLGLLYKEARALTLEAAAEGRLPASRAHRLLLQLRRSLRVVDQLTKAARRVETLLPEPGVEEQRAAAARESEVQDSDGQPVEEESES